MIYQQMCLVVLLHITAWGHETLPDLDYQTDDIKDQRYKQYPMQKRRGPDVDQQG